MLTILAPLKMASAFQKISDPLIVAIYAALIITSIIAGITTWAISRSAFVWLRVHFLARFLYALFQFYIGARILNRAGAINDTAQEEFIFGAVNLLTVLILFLYFRLSSRVYDTFGRNI